MVIKGSLVEVSLCRDLFLFLFCGTKQFIGATYRHYSEIAQLQIIFLNWLMDKSFQVFLEKMLEKMVSATNKYFQLLI